MTWHHRAGIKGTASISPEVGYQLSAVDSAALRGYLVCRWATTSGPTRAAVCEKFKKNLCDVGNYKSGRNAAMEVNAKSYLLLLPASLRAAQSTGI